MSVVDAIRQPEYTGENRCMPCTIANAVIAVGLSAGVAGGALAAGASVAVAAGAGVGVFLVSAAAIYLRGYLVPGTPELTKRYFPEWVLAKFDKKPEQLAQAERAAEESELDPEAALLSAGAVEPCQEVDDLCLAPGFHDAWRDRIRTVRDRGFETDDIVDALSMDDLAEEVTLNQFGEAVVLERDAVEVGKWESQAALVADMAAAEELAGRYDGWADLDATDRSRLLRGLRIFAEECPLCDGPIELGQDTVESCCRSYEVVAVTCNQCEARLFEEEWEGEAVA